VWTRWVTIGSLAATLVFLIGWDIYVATNAIHGDTISELVLSFSRRVLILPTAVGIIAGHMLWPSKKVLPATTTFCILASVVAVVIVVDVVGHPTITPAIPFAIGVGIGHFGWGQREV
jgi:hypothetical protein